MVLLKSFGVKIQKKKIRPHAMNHDLSNRPGNDWGEEKSKWFNLDILRLIDA